MATRNENAMPFMAVHPCGILREELKSRGLKQNVFAKMIDVQPSHLNELLHGKRDINQSIASKLENVLGIPATSWLNLQYQYDLQKKVLAERGEKELIARSEIESYNSIISVHDLCVRFKFNGNTNIKILSFLKNNLKLPSPQVIVKEYFAYFRKSEKTGLDKRMLLTWLLIANIKGKQLSTTNKFKKTVQPNLISGLRVIFNDNNNTIERTTKILSDYGIRFAIEPKLEKASIDGCSFMVDEEPCIILTNRYNHIDKFAFNVMHELGHVYKHLSIETPFIISHDSLTPSSRVEKEANNFASEALIPKDVWEKAPSFPSRLNKYNFQQYYTNWARSLNYNKWIVLGRISHELSLYNLRDDGSRKIK